MSQYLTGLAAALHPPSASTHLNVWFSRKNGAAEFCQMGVGPAVFSWPWGRIPRGNIRADPKPFYTNGSRSLFG